MEGTKAATLAGAVEAHVRPGDVIHVMLGHARWTAAAREVVRSYWRSDPGFVLVMASLSSLGALFFRGGLVRKVITAYSGDAFPTYTPNPIFQHGYGSGAVAVEHWSFLTLAQRLEAAARGLPAAVTGSLRGSAMEANGAYSLAETELGPVGLVAPLVPDVALVHAAVADESGNLVVAPPLLEGVWGAWAARRGVVATTDALVESLPALGLGHRVNIPGHRVLATVPLAFGAHPGGSFAAGLPGTGYGEDIPFWAAAREAARGSARNGSLAGGGDGDPFDAWARSWVLDIDDHDAYLARLGTRRLDALRARADPQSWRADAAAHPVDGETPAGPWEVAAALAARETVTVVDRLGADAVLAGAGVANLAAWVAVGSARAAGSDVVLVAELGLWHYTPTPADPYVFNHRVFPDTAALSDASTILGMVVGGPGTCTVACLGAAQVDERGDINSTELRAGTAEGKHRFLVGSGGGNDVASRAASCVVVTLARPERLPARVDYVTSPGHHVDSIVTDRGILRRVGGRLQIAAVVAGEEPVAERVRALAGACGWDVEVARDLQELEPVMPVEVARLRDFDRQRLFLS